MWRVGCVPFAKGLKQPSQRDRRVSQLTPNGEAPLRATSQLRAPFCSGERAPMGRLARLVAVAALASGADATVTSTSTFERCVNDEPCEERLTMQVRGPPQTRGGRWTSSPPR